MYLLESGSKIHCEFKVTFCGETSIVAFGCESKSVYYENNKIHKRLRSITSIAFTIRTIFTLVDHSGLSRFVLFVFQCMTGCRFAKTKKGEKKQKKLNNLRKISRVHQKKFFFCDFQNIPGGKNFPIFLGLLGFILG